MKHQTSILSFAILLSASVGGPVIGAPAIEAPARRSSLVAAAALAQAFGLPVLSDASRVCVECHRKESPAIYEMWGDSMHFRGNVGCYECHAAEPDDPDVLEHYEYAISVIVSPKDCARCHSREVEEFASSRHAKAGRIIGSLDNVLAEVVEGNSALKTPASPHGNSAAAITGCWQCHGSQVKVLPSGKLDAATWPNTGIGRLNPDGSEGSCSACHLRHTFAAAQARHPDNCGRCHMGPDHPQMEVYRESKHGVAFYANVETMNLDARKWIIAEDYSAAPTCATCHMSATKNQPVSHDVGLRISWNNRPAVSIRPELADASMNLPGADVPWETRRLNMYDVCLNCHNKQWVDNFYVQYDGLVDLYNKKFGEPGQQLYGLAQPLMNPVQFTNKLDFVWYEIWHHEGRRARHGASMMGPDYTHWHGMYEVAKHWYSEFIPGLRQLVVEGRASDDPARVKAAEALHNRLEAVLKSDNHKWYLGEMDPAEVKRRREAAAQFGAGGRP